MAHPAPGRPASAGRIPAPALLLPQEAILSQEKLLVEGPCKLCSAPGPWPGRFHRSRVSAGARPAGHGAVLLLNPSALSEEETFDAFRAEIGGLSILRLCPSCLRQAAPACELAKTSSAYALWPLETLGEPLRHDGVQRLDALLRGSTFYEGLFGQKDRPSEMEFRFRGPDHFVEAGNFALDVHWLMRLAIYPARVVLEMANLDTSPDSFVAAEMQQIEAAVRKEMAAADTAVAAALDKALAQWAQHFFG